MLSPLPTDSPLAAKLESGLAHYLSSTLPAVTPRLTIRTSYQGGAAIDFPLLLLTVGDLADSDLPSSCGTWLFRLTLAFYFPPAGHAYPDALERLESSTQAALADLPSLQAFLNLPETGVDSRPVDAFHLHDLWPENLADLDPAAPAHYLSRLHYRALATGADRTFAPAPPAVTLATTLTLGGVEITLGTSNITLAYSV